FSGYVKYFCFQAEDGIRDFHVTGVQTCALPICTSSADDHVADTTVHTALDHAEANIAHSIGGTLRSQGRYHLAHAVFKRTYQLRTEALGSEHPDTLATRHDLAGVLQDLGQLEQARTEYEAVFDIRTKLLGGWAS